MKYELCQSSKKDDHTEMSAETSTALKMSKIIVRKAGDDLEKEFRQAIMDAIKQKSEMIELVINLNSESCAYAYDVAKKCDFSLSGIIPGAQNGDYIVLQMLLGDKMNYDNLVLVGEFEELRSDIVSITGYDKKEK